MHRSAIVAVLILVAATVCGCAKYTSPVGPQPKLTAGQHNFEAVWEAALQVLQEHYFEIDRQDRRDRVITTLPLTGKHWWELWRRDAIGTDAIAESTVQTIYRTVTVRIRPAGPGETTYAADVEVAVFRSDRHEQQTTSTSDAYDLFRQPGSVGEKQTKVLWEESPGEQEGSTSAVPLGRDARLEAALAARIRAAATSRITAPPS